METKLYIKLLPYWMQIEHSSSIEIIWLQVDVFGTSEQ